MNNRYIETLADGFAKIEAQDINVGYIEVSTKYWDEISKYANLADYHITYLGPMNRVDPAYPEGAPSYYLWGAKVFLKNSSRSEVKIFSGEGCIPIVETINLLNNRLIIYVKTRARPFWPSNPNEYRAIETLREMITETEFRKFLKYGFITVQGKSNYTYQIERERPHIKVWDKGKLLEEICINLPGDVPLTDRLIAFKVMIETDEQDFRKYGNVYKMQKVA